ncbi:sensor histidine kinase [Amaricoccus sp.]|uniref:sensor histidine kinase n=1 Tax=Amaricoccus sp. TaxID=1872485 RepID=UPI0025B7F955|nr:sensor histidine kinase [Amaricoccus sp.]
MAPAMIGGNLLVAVCLGYVACLFAVAAWAERRAAQGRFGWLRAPLVYTLSLSVYCTAWTFYGAVGAAARGGLDYLPIYLGPTIVFVGWFFLLRKLVRVGHVQRITSIADMISSRYGKSPALGVAVTIIAVVGSTPYIALQLKSVTLSFAAFAAHDPAGAAARPAWTGLWVAAGLAVFTILFGTRSVDANERHHGVVSAIAVEAVVKLLALVCLGVYVTWGLFRGPSGVFDAMPPALMAEHVLTPRWVTQVFLAGCAVVCLPRMFQVLVVENVDERQLATAGWAFPLYLALISAFVVPIAVAGLATAPEGANPDLFVLTVPLAAGRDDLALLAFLGGFSAATSMVIVAAIALSTMVSNHIVIPLWLRWRRGREGDLRRVLLLARRLSIAGVLALGYVYFLVSAPSALAAIGLISFAGAAQVAPALAGALYWRGATRAGALAGIAAGFAVWAYTLFLPSFEGAFLMSAAAIADGPFGLDFLRPRALFGLGGWDPLVHAVFWSMTANVGAFVAVSLATTPRPLEQFQAALFVDVFRQSAAAPGVVSRSATSEDLLGLAARLLGPGAAQALFAGEARAQGKAEGLPAPTDRFIDRLERELAGTVGAASAHELVNQTAGRGAVSVDGLMRMADETLQLIDAKRRLENQSRELEEAARQLRHANDQLKRMDAAKDAFLSQVSHELRTPMTSIRSFAEILGDAEGLDEATTRRFLGIIRDESVRLTRLLDEILDLSFLESGRVSFHVAPVRVGEVIDRALAATEGLRASSGVPVERGAGGDDIVVDADFDRLTQVVVNLVSNAIKYGRSDAPRVTISAGATGEDVYIDVADRGPGIPPERRDEVFQKFQRLGEANLAGSAGLGLPISREIMRNLGGDLVVLPNAPGAVFRVRLPRQARPASAAE